MSPTHACPKEGCGAECPRHLLACRVHWFSVTASTRARVNRTWRGYSDGRLDLSEYLAARADAIEEMNRRGA